MRDVARTYRLLPKRGAYSNISFLDDYRLAKAVELGSLKDLYRTIGARLRRFTARDFDAGHR